MSINFDKAKKYIGSCCGNSFIILDCRNINVDKQQKSDFSKKNIIKYNVDSALFIGDVKGFDISIEIFEKDGSESDSCGNGLLLVTYLLGLNKGKVKMKGGSVIIEGNSEKQAILIDIKLSDVKEINSEKNCLFIRVGEPHIIFLVGDFNSFDLIATGDKLQRNYLGGVNVDVIKKIDDLHFLIKTYERGVFNETKSCGTGSLSSYVAISHFYNKMYEYPVEFKSSGGIHLVSKIGDMLKLETLKKFCEIKALD